MDKFDNIKEHSEYKKNLKDFYDKFATRWDTRFKPTKAADYFYRKRLEAIIKYLGKGYSTLLEAGCGSGYHIMHILKEGQEGLGFDISEKMVELATVTKNNKFPHLNLNFIVDDGENLNIPNNKYERVIFIGYLVHLEQPQKALDELFKVLKPGGRLVGLVSNRWSPWVSLKIRKIVTNDFGILSKTQEFSPPQIKEMVKKAGFKNTRLAIFNSLPAVLPDWFYYPARIINLIFLIWPFSVLGFHIALIAEK